MPSTIFASHSNLEWCTFECSLEFLEPAFFDEFMGGVLRSALGYALRQTSDLPSYRYLFETPQNRSLPERQYSEVPRPFVLCVPNQGQTWFATGEAFRFYLTLIGKGISYFPNFLDALCYMGQRGIGIKYSKFALMSIESLGLSSERRIVYSEGDSFYSESFFKGSLEQLHKEKSHAALMLLTLLTPARLKTRGALVKPGSFTFDIYLKRLVERIRALGYFHNDMPWFDLDESLMAEARNIQLESRLQWQDWDFYVNGRARKMGGLVGQAILRGHVAPFCGALKAAQWLHVGKNTTYGFGAVAVQL